MNNDAPAQSTFERASGAMEVDNTEFNFKTGNGEQVAGVNNNPESNDEYDHVPKKDGGRASAAGKKSAKSTVEEEELGVWGNLEKPFIGFKMASMTLKKILKNTPEKLEQNDSSE